MATKLYLGEGSNQPLLVGFGGAEGGNAWASDYHEEQRQAFLNHGYAFLALAYIQRRPQAPASIPSPDGIPAKIDRISLNAVHEAILKASENPNINGACIAVIGGSRGGKLVLELASRFKDIKAVIALAPSDVGYMGGPPLQTGAWSYNGKTVPYVPLSGRALPALLKQDIAAVIEISRHDDPLLDEAVIQVTHINGPILLMSGSHDELWASTEMSHNIMNRLDQANFPYEYHHITVSGGHTAPGDHLDYAMTFLDRYFMPGNGSDCARESTAQ